MCTLSWRRNSEGFELHFNRDERHSRARAHPPVASSSGRLRLLAPRDGDFGGAWLGVNERGVAIALLNGWHLRAPKRADYRSRGLLVIDALAHESVGSLAAWVQRCGLDPYRPFTLCAFAPGADEPLRADWEGRSLSLAALRDASRPLVSSSYRFADVVEERRRLWSDIVGTEASTESLAKFHATHRPERGPFSTCMHRHDASTKSYTVIRVDRKSAEIRYLDSAPCEGGQLHVAELPLRCTEDA